MAHELGHYAQHRGMGYPSFGYAASVSDPECTCGHYDAGWGNQDHCMQSREHFEAATIEGFGHAFADRTFNAPSSSEATIVHYKPFQEDNEPDPFFLPYVVRRV